MRFSKYLLSVLFIIFFSIPVFPQDQHVQGTMVEMDQKTEPAYAKWGRLAVEKTKAKYPHAQIVDYLHVGRVQNPKVTTETFKLWLREKNREFGVLITIEFETLTEKIRNISIRETAK
jgi:hypothetical protein